MNNHMSDFDLTTQLKNARQIALQKIEQHKIREENEKRLKEEANKKWEQKLLEEEIKKNQEKERQMLMKRPPAEFIWTSMQELCQNEMVKDLFLSKNVTKLRVFYHPFSERYNETIYLYPSGILEKKERYPGMWDGTTYYKSINSSEELAKNCNLEFIEKFKTSITTGSLYTFLFEEN